MKGRSTRCRSTVFPAPATARHASIAPSKQGGTATGFVPLILVRSVERQSDLDSLRSEHH